MRQEYVEEQISLLGRVAEFWRLTSIQAGVNVGQWTLGPWSDELGVSLDSDDPEISYYITKKSDGYLLQVRSRAEVRPTTLFGNYADAVKLVSLTLGSEFRRSFHWRSLYDIWSDDVPVGIVKSVRENGLARYFLGVDPSRFVETSWKGPQQSRLLLLTIDELHEVILTPPSVVDE